MTIQEVYEKYKHLDQCLSDGEWIGDDFKFAIILDLWQTIKTTAQAEKIRLGVKNMQWQKLEAIAKFKANWEAK